MPYAILRTAKLSTFGNVGGSASHNFRERLTFNADPARTPSNRTAGAQSSKEVIEAVKARLETVPTVRKNAVLVVEYFIGASPEWFGEQSSKVQYLNLAFLALLVTHLRRNPYRTPIGERPNSEIISCIIFGARKIKCGIVDGCRLR